jgi:hypothetical protein
MQQNPQGESAVWLLGIPLVGLAGIVIALTSLNKPSHVIAGRAKVTLGLAFYPLICIGLLYLGLRGPQESGQIDIRPLIQIEFGFWGTVLASLAMLFGAILDIAAARRQPASQSVLPPAASLAKPPGPSGVPATPSRPVALPVIQQPRESPSAQPVPVTRAMGWLEGQNGEWARQKVEIFNDTLTIGRHHDNDLHLNDKSVSRYHALIRCGRGRFFIQDQGSAVGTYVNGQQVDACELKPCDVIRIGSVEFRFQTA